jgi:lipopolysaccharide/colanic/teichoic acid biosynthesis glycosyltransferase
MTEPSITFQDPTMSERKRGAAALTTGQFLAVDYIPASVLVAKRAMDIAVALVGLMVTLPLWPLVALAIRLDSSGPVVYRQMRVGRMLSNRTELFMILKFRSMNADAERVTGAVWAQKHDPRITRVGAFIRRTRLDELPQLINVLRGDMSVVGPRPERPAMYRRLEQAVPFFADRTAGLRPGVTGLTQVVQGYDNSVEDVRRKVGFDAAYAMRLATFGGWLVSDMTIMLRTLNVMVSGRGQ